MARGIAQKRNQLRKESRSTEGYNTLGYRTEQLFQRYLNGDQSAKGKLLKEVREELAVSKCSQFQRSDGRWVKRDTQTGKIVDVKSNDKPFKGVAKKKDKRRS